MPDLRSTFASVIGGKSAPDAPLRALRSRLVELRDRAGERASLVDRLEADAAAVIYHAQAAGKLPLPTVLLGGTGTGKSTIVNRLLGQDVSAASFRRTFTAGAVAVAAEAQQVPQEWLAVEHVLLPPAELPARGAADRLTVALLDHPLTRRLLLVDTPDLDGETPEHHAQADRAFRWASAVVFVVTPEKYQMTELAGYYRLAVRYGVPTRFVMNKLDDPAASRDWAGQLTDLVGRTPTIFEIPRDDAGYTAPPDRDLPAFRDALLALEPADPETAQAGLAARRQDLAGRVTDQLVAPLRQRRKQVDAAARRLTAMIAPEAGVDVHPMTRTLQRRLQEQSVLYLMGPGRIVDRIVGLPQFLARLPRKTWDAMTGTNVGEGGQMPPPRQTPPDFRTDLVDAFTVCQSRIEDVLRDAKLELSGWRIEPDAAGKIADEEIADLQRWLENRWNAKPRDTRLVQKLVGFLPGGKNVHKLSETAPYLLTAYCAMSGAMFGGLDMIALGGYSLATWLTERLSNEVAARTRQANRRINERFGALCEEQVKRARSALQSLAPSTEQLAALQRAAEEVAGE